MRELRDLQEQWTEIEAQENHEWLLERYVELLARQEPSSVLDVGCGAGLLMKSCAAHGIEVIGLDQGGPKLEALVAEGFDARDGSAYELPFDDDAVDWVSMRHVPHHLAEPGRAFAEALRVARVGFLVAEPLFDANLPTQRSARELDVWEKRQHRRGGMFHDEVYALDALLALLPPERIAALEIEAHQHFRPRARSLETFRATAEELVADLEPDHEERRALAEHLESWRVTGLSWNGSLCLIARKSSR